VTLRSMFFMNVESLDSRKGFCVSAGLNTKILLMLSFGEQGRYSATSKVITAVLLRIEIWDVKTPCGLAF
jgi:hypothetical protein